MTTDPTLAEMMTERLKAEAEIHATRRFQAACAAMTGLLARGTGIALKEAASISVEAADDLLSELDRTREAKQAEGDVKP